jgi:radical SAM protein with 4Fe4S-binding SPASM domain
MPIIMNRMSIAKRINLFKSGANLIYRRLTPWGMPIHMQFELTNFCNLRCPVCPAGIKAVKRPPRTVDVELFDLVLNEVGPYLLTLSLWGWGEPLLHPHLQSILRSTRRYQIATFLSTNGQNLNDDQVIEALTKEPPTYLIVAIDGLTDEINTRFRKGAQLAPILEGVRRIAQIKQKMGLRLPLLHMRYIVMKHNQHEMPHLVDFARRNQFDLLTIRTLSIIDVESTARIHHELVPDIHEWRAYDYEIDHRIERGDFICLQPFWFPTVFADGTLVACEQDYNAQQPMGVISKDVSFSKLWRGKRASSIRRIIRETPQRLSFCRNCPYRDRETTDCSVQAHFLNPRIDYSRLVMRYH